MRYTTDPKKRLLDGALLLGTSMVLFAAACEVPAEDAEPVKAPVVGKSSKATSKAKKVRTVWSDGMYKVPDEIKPGTYETDGNDTGCYWERLRGASGDFNDIIANGGETPGPGTMTVKKTDAYIKFSLGCDWKRASN